MCPPVLTVRYPGAVARSPEMVALEVTREKLYQRVNQELPYRCAVKHVDWQYFRDGSVRVEQEILVRRTPPPPSPPSSSTPWMCSCMI